MIEISAFAPAAAALEAAVKGRAANPATIAQSVQDPAARALLGDLLSPRSAPPSLATSLTGFTVDKTLSKPSRPPCVKASGSAESGPPGTVGRALVFKAIPGSSATERARCVLASLRAAGAESASLARPIGFHAEHGFAFVVRP